MKRLFVSLMVIGGSILFGMQAAASAPKKLTLKERAIKCAKRSRTRNVAVPLSELLGSEKQVRKGCFRRVVMAERRRVRAARNRLCGKLSPAAKKRAKNVSK